MEHLALAEHLDRYRSRFSGPHLELVLASMIAGNTAGELWAGSQADTFQLLLLWDRGNNNFYLAGESRTRSSLESLTAALAMQIRPRALIEGAIRFKVRALTPSLEESLHSLFRGIDLRKTSTLFFVHDAARPLPTESTIVPNVAVVPITSEILAPGALAHSEHVRAEIGSMWSSEERFYEHGFGTAAVVEDEIIGWCTAEYVSPTSCGIGIATSPRYERRGVATATASHFLREARARGIMAHWECEHMNHASVRVAEKVGFLRRSEETYWVGSFEQ